MHFIVRFDPVPGCASEFRDALRRVVEATRTEPGCLRIDAFESASAQFAIHSEWRDEAAFELHATMPHTLEFLAAAGRLLSHPVAGLRLKRIDP